MAKSAGKTPGKAAAGPAVGDVVKTGAVAAKPGPANKKEPARGRKPSAAAAGKAASAAAKTVAAGPRAGSAEAKDMTGGRAASAAAGRAGPAAAANTAAAKRGAKPARAKDAAGARAKTGAAAGKPHRAKSAGRRRAGRPAAPEGRRWLKSYPAGVPTEIGPLAHPSIGELLVSACRQYAGRPAFTSMGRQMSYAELEAMSASFGAWLQAKGLARGARVAIMMPNVLQYPVAMMGILRAGYTVVNVNPLYTPRELEHQLADCGAEAILILENFATTLQAVARKLPSLRHVVVASMGDLLGLKGMIVNFVVRRVKKMVPAWSLAGHVPFRTVLKEGAASRLEPVETGPDDIAFLQYTGGTTGISKGAILLHRNVLANVAQLALWTQDAYRVKPKPAEQVYVCALPLYHIFALTVNALMGMQQGANNILIANPRDIPALVKELGRRPFHIFPGLNTLFNALLNNEDFRKLDFKPLILTIGGGMAVQKPVARRWLEATGGSITEGYGLSETSPVATANRFSATEFTGTIGLPLPSTDVSIRDDDGNELPAGEVGEICIRGPQVMAGYWNRPEETAKAMTADGFFKSGDMGFMDGNGYTKLVDRKKDMILVSGFNVYPNELEDVVARHPGVLEVAAIGVPDEHAGEVPKLFVVRKDPGLTEEALKAYCRENFTGYKRPRHIEFRTELPKTPVGKILRRRLRD